MSQKRKAMDEATGRRHATKCATLTSSLKLHGGAPEAHTILNSRPNDVNDESVYVPPLDWPETASWVAAGQPNPGHLCYRRAMLQALVHLPCLMNFLWDNEQACKAIHSESTYCHICKVAHLTRTLWNSRPDFAHFVIDVFDAYIDGHAVFRHDAAEVINANGSRPEDEQESYVINSCEWMLGTNQEDAMDFLHWLTGILIDHPTFGASARKMFQMEVTGVWGCSTCASIFDAPSSVDLGCLLSIEQALGVELGGYINQYFEAVRLDHAICENKSCRTFGKPRPADRHPKIVHAPQILFIVLRRTTKGQKKTRKRIKYPFSLDLGKHTHIHKFKGTAHYQLSSVVCHQGSTTFSGHYIAYVTGKSGRILKYDDEHFYRVDLAEMLKPKSDFDPYILTYVRQQPYEGAFAIPDALAKWTELLPKPQIAHQLMSKELLQWFQRHFTSEQVDEACYDFAQVLRRNPQRPSALKHPPKKASLSPKQTKSNRQRRRASQSPPQQQPPAPSTRRHTSAPPRSRRSNSRVSKTPLPPALKTKKSVKTPSPKHSNMKTDDRTHESHDDQQVHYAKYNAGNHDCGSDAADDRSLFEDQSDESEYELIEPSSQTQKRRKTQQAVDEDAAYEHSEPSEGWEENGSEYESTDELAG